MLAPVLAAAAAASGALALAASGRYRRGRRSLQQRLQAHRQPPQVGGPRAWLDRLDAARWLRPLAAALSDAGLHLRPSAALALLLVLAALAIRLFARLVQAPPLLVSPFVAAAAPLGFQHLRRALRRRSAEQADAQLVEACRLLSGALRAGLSVPQGLAVLAAQLPSPAGAHFRRLCGELTLGVPLDGALADLYRRLPSRNLRLLGLAISLNRQLGGDLPGALADLGRTLAERQQVQAGVAAATAEPRFVAALLPVMPVAIALLLSALIPGFLHPLFTPWGLLLLAACLLLQVTGILVVRRVTRIPL